MRRHVRALIMIAVMLAAALLVLGVQQISLGDFERGGTDTILGLSLGLDLQGGSHLVYQAALTDPVTGEPIPVSSDQMQALKKIIERRVNSSGLGEPIIQLLGEDRILIQLPGVGDPGRAKEFIGETARLEFKHRMFNVPRDLTEITGAEIVSVTAGFLPHETEDESPEPAVAPEGSGEAVLEGAEAAEGTETAAAPELSEAEGESTAVAAAPQMQPDGPPLLIVEFTDDGAGKFAEVLDRLNESLGMLTSSGGLIPPSHLDVSIDGAESLRFQVNALSMQRIAESTRFAISLPPDNVFSTAPNAAAAQTLLGDSPEIFFVEIQGKVDEDIGLTGDDLSNAYAGQHSASGAPIVNLEFNSEGTRTFGELTEVIVAKTQRTGERDQIAIFLDDEELIAPVVETVITAGSAFIQGRDFTVQRVSDLALLLESGRLPVPIELIQERTVDAILGADSLSKSAVAGIIGVALVLLFMILYYRASGIVASLALLIYGMLLLAIFKILPVTLTLSGVAAAILSIGMAVDANILIFERMKEELRAGRTLLSAVNIGFNRAWPAIRDSNVSTLITCAILYYFSSRLGTTAVQGFAFTLAVGVLLSMFSAITLSRTFLRVLAATKLGRRLGLFVPIGGADLPQLKQSPRAPALERS